MGIVWISPDDSEVVQCNIENTACNTTRTFVGHYKGFVESKTQLKLVIESFNLDTDTGKWSCSDGLEGTKSACEKKTKCK